ncbi:MAG: hypothetical protein WA419_11240 [Silvibacterium sp.]
MIRQWNGETHRVTVCESGFRIRQYKNR